MSALVFGFSAWGYARHREIGLSVLDPRFYEPRHAPTPDEVVAAEHAYALRIRADGFDCMARGDFEIALVRFDQAVDEDRFNTDPMSPEERHARDVITEKLGMVGPAAPAPGSTASPPRP